MTERVAIRMPGSVEPQRCKIWEGGSPGGTAFALALLTSLGPEHRRGTRFVKLGRLAFDSMSPERQNYYLQKYLVAETGSYQAAVELIEQQPHDHLVVRCTFDSVQGANKLREAQEIAATITELSERESAENESEADR